MEHFPAMSLHDDLGESESTHRFLVPQRIFTKYRHTLLCVLFGVSFTLRCRLYFRTPWTLLGMAFNQRQ